MGKPSNSSSVRVTPGSFATSRNTFEAQGSRVRSSQKKNTSSCNVTAGFLIRGHPLMATSNDPRSDAADQIGVKLGAADAQESLRIELSLSCCHDCSDPNAIMGS